MNKTYTTSKWGEVSEDFLIKKKKKASTCGMFFKFSLLFLFLSGVCCAVTVLTIQDMLTLELDSRLLLMVFLGLAAAALLFFIIWTIMFFAFDVIGIKKALNEAKKQEIDRMQKEQQPEKDESGVQSSLEQPDTYEDLPIITESVEEFPVTLDSDENDPLPVIENDDEELSLDDDEDFRDETEEMAEEEDAESSVDNRPEGTEKLDESLSDDFCESESKEESTSTMNDFPENPYGNTGRDNEEVFQAIFEEMKEVFFDHLRNKDNEILALKAQLFELEKEKSLISAHLVNESAKRKELEDALNEALKKIESMEYIRKDSENISIEMLPQAEIIPLNMEIRIPSNKEVFPEAPVRETGFARDVREVGEALDAKEYNNSGI